MNLLRSLLLGAGGGSSLFLLLAAVGCSTCSRPVTPAPALVPGATAPIIYKTNYHGWKDAIIMSGHGLEVVVVPAIGRLLQFGFAGEEGVFWVNDQLRGKTPPEKPVGWMNFGGDKSWPAPESDWPKRTNTFWHPPFAFDSKPVEALVGSHGVTLAAPTDTNYLIRSTRVIELGPEPGTMRVETRYEKVGGERQSVSVWTISQLREPLAVFAPVRPDSQFPRGFRTLSRDEPPTLRIQDRVLSLTRSPNAAYKIGLDADRLIWVGERQALMIESPRFPGAEYPDGGSSTEIYTNPDPLKYVELEMLSPLRRLRDGDSYSLVVTYRLFPRREATPEAEARRILAETVAR